MPPIRCFWLTPLQRFQEYLRRYARDIKAGCPASTNYYHEGITVLGEVQRPSDLIPDATGRAMNHHPAYPETDERWPTECACGYRFTPDDHYQHNLVKLYQAEGPPYTDQLFTMNEAPVGAMWDAYWYSSSGPDGLCIFVRTPAGDWGIDLKSEDGKGWTRTGTPPGLTVTPSILIKTKNVTYHGWLRGGHLVEC